MAITLRIPTTPENVLNLIVTKVVTDGVFDASASYLSLYEESTPVQPSGDLLMVVAPGPRDFNQSFMDGSLTVNPESEGYEWLSIWTRVQSDEIQRDDQWLRDPNNGVLPKLRAVMNSLNGYDPVDGSGNGLLSQPMRFLGYEVERRTNQAGWGRVKCRVETFFQFQVP